MNYNSLKSQDLKTNQVLTDQMTRVHSKLATNKKKLSIDQQTHLPLKPKQVAKREITLTAVSSRQQTNSSLHVRKLSQTSTSSLLTSTAILSKKVQPSNVLLSSRLSVKKQLSMQISPEQPKALTTSQKPEPYVSKVDGRRMIKRIISENLKRQKSKQAQLDASLLVQKQSSNTNPLLDATIAKTQSTPKPHQPFRLPDQKLVDPQQIFQKRCLIEDTNHLKTKTKQQAAKHSLGLNLQKLSSHPQESTQNFSNFVELNEQKKTAQRNSDIIGPYLPQIDQSPSVRKTFAILSSFVTSTYHRPRILQLTTLMFLLVDQVLVQIQQPNTTRLSKRKQQTGQIKREIQGIVPREQASILTVGSSSLDFAGSMTTEQLIAAHSSFTSPLTERDDEFYAGEGKQIADKMHIYSQMQVQPMLEETLLMSLEIVQRGMALDYVKSRIAEVMKISEIQMIWTFLLGYRVSEASTLRQSEVRELRELLHLRVITDLMGDKHSSVQRYFKLSEITQTFDDPLRALDLILLQNPEKIATAVWNILSQELCSKFLKQQNRSWNDHPNDNRDEHMFHSLCRRLEQLKERSLIELQAQIIKTVRDKILETRDGEDVRKGSTLLASEEAAQECIRDFIVGISQPKVLLLRYDATWLFQGSSQLELPAVGKLVLDAYLAFLKAQKLKNVFYCIPWQTISLLFPAPGESPLVPATAEQKIEYCHDRIVDTLHATSIAMKDLKVLDVDSLKQIEAFFSSRNLQSSFFIDHQKGRGI